MIYYIGVDPGKTGAVVMLSTNRPAMKVPAASVTDALIKILSDVKLLEQPIFVTVEEPIKIPFQSVTSTATQWQNFGEVIGVLKALGTSYMTIKASLWQKSILPGRPGKNKGEKPGAFRKRLKTFTIQAMLARFPEFKELTDGEADALALALYGISKNHEDNQVKAVA